RSAVRVVGTVETTTGINRRRDRCNQAHAAGTGGPLTERLWGTHVPRNRAKGLARCRFESTGVRKNFRIAQVQTGKECKITEWRPRQSCNAEPLRVAFQ